MLRVGFWGGSDFDQDRVGGTHWIKVDKRGNNDWYQGAFAIVLTPRRARNLVEKLRLEQLCWADQWTGLPGTYMLDKKLLYVKGDMQSSVQTPYHTNQ